jgi:uncharacterized protein
MHERKTVTFILKGIDEQARFEGMAAVYGVKDRVGDVIEVGAFAKTARENPDVPILYLHKDPIGSGRVEDSWRGLRVYGRLLVDHVEKAREAYALVKEGAIKGLSVGFSIVKDQWDSARGVRRILEAKLYEVSIVAVPANELAQIEVPGSPDSDIKRAIAEWQMERASLEWRALRRAS